MKEKDNPRNGWGKKCLQMEIQGILQSMHTVHAAQFKEKKKKKTIEKWTKDQNGRFSKEDIQVDIKYTKRCSASLIIREMQITSSMTYHFPPVSMAISKIQQ